MGTTKKTTTTATDNKSKQAAAKKATSTQTKNTTATAPKTPAADKTTPTTPKAPAAEETAPATPKVPEAEETAPAAPKAPAAPATTETTPTVKVDPESAQYVRENLKKIESAETAYELFKENGKVKDLVIGIKQFKDFITGDRKEEPLEYISNSYRFYNLTIKQLNVQQYSLFKLRLDFILKILMREKNKELTLVNLLKFDHYWKYGQKTRISYYLLMTFLEGMADPRTRKDELKRMDVDKLADYVPESLMLNFRRYFNV